MQQPVQAAYILLCTVVVTISGACSGYYMRQWDKMTHFRGYEVTILEASVAGYREDGTTWDDPGKDEVLWSPDCRNGTVGMLTKQELPDGSLIDLTGDPVGSIDGAFYIDEDCKQVEIKGNEDTHLPDPYIEVISKDNGNRSTEVHYITSPRPNTTEPHWTRGMTFPPADDLVVFFHVFDDDGDKGEHVCSTELELGANRLGTEGGQVILECDGVSISVTVELLWSVS